MTSEDRGKNTWYSTPKHQHIFLHFTNLRFDINSTPQVSDLAWRKCIILQLELFSVVANVVCHVVI